MLRPLLRRHKYVPLNTIELHAQNLLDNIALFQTITPDKAIIPVIKGNAYGHGLPQVAKVLNEASCAFVAVDGYFEAHAIRRITRHPILVLGYIRPENVRLLDTRRCSFVVQDTAGLEALATLKRPVRVHMELNTGMNRLGLTPDELDTYLKVLRCYPQLELEGVMSHLADADNPDDNSFTDKQVGNFDTAVAHILADGWQPKFIHLAQSAGSTKAVSRYANAIRPGIGIYGIHPLSSADPNHRSLAALRPVLEVSSTLIKIIDLKKGEKVSYNGIFTAPRTMKIGVIPFGYYEGLPRELSNKGSVTLGSEVLPIVGRICMNHHMIDLKEHQAKVGDHVTIISADPKQPNSVAGLQQDFGIFSYSLLTGLSSTIRRNIIR